MKLDPSSLKANAEARELPDVSRNQKTQFSAALSQVGMQDIELPVRLRSAGQIYTLLASVDAFVSLDDPHAKGIHMSRLYLELKTIFQDEFLNITTLQKALTQFLTTHKGMSESAYVRVNFKLPVERKALVSSEVGHRQYPVFFEALLHQGQRAEVNFGYEIMYSSTCPCSAALARQVIVDGFQKKFQGKDLLPAKEVSDWLVAEEVYWAVPHAQRSLAKIKIRLSESVIAPDVLEWIDASELALGTPVQAAVKRVDEQEFARLNGANLMFCEDAARKLKNTLDSDPRLVDYIIHVEHQESLHPHDAVSRVVKGVAGGFSVSERYD